VRTTRLAEQIADAVLYEGYVLYPYRASAPKNRSRWQVGLVAPRTFAEAAGSDPWFTQTECLAEIDRGASLTIRVRCLHVQERTIEQPVPGSAAEWRAVNHLLVGNRELIPWDEAVACEFRQEELPLDAVPRESPREWRWTWSLAATEAIDMVRDHTGAAVARMVRRRQPVCAAISVETQPCASACSDQRRGALKIRVRIKNVTPCVAHTLSQRDEAVRHSLVGTHAILAIDNGAFVSLLDPPAELAALAQSCVNTHAFPVLAGPPGSRDVMLSSPIILYDYPAVAPESAGDLCDGTEIDELLTLRVRTLTDAEKREARATDARAAEIVDRCEAASPEAIGKLHGAVRSLESFLNPEDEPSPEAGWVEIGGTRIRRGTQVRLQPVRPVDSMDICLQGRTATVNAVYRTLEDQPYVAVTLDEDPFGAEGVKYRRSLFFHPEELVPLDRGAE